MSSKDKTTLVSLLDAAQGAHAQAFRDSGTEDPDWAIWYADFLLEHLAEQLDIRLHRSQLIYCLMSAEIEHQAMAPSQPWPGFYADHILDHYAPSDTPAEDHLALYHFDGCPFCSVVRQAIDSLGLDVESRDILADAGHREALISARGRATVPVLLIESPDGEAHWMPESRDICNYLMDRYG